MARTKVKLLDTCLRRISKTETFLTSLRRLGPLAARRAAASSPLKPFLGQVSTGRLIMRLVVVLGIDTEMAREKRDISGVS